MLIIVKTILPMEKEKNIEFVAKRYRRGAFNADTAWRKLGITPVLWWKRRLKTAAAIAAVVVLSTTAALLYRLNMADETSQSSTSAETVNVMAEVRVIDFENTPLLEVVAEIETLYNVKVENLPADPERFELSLHYEGTPGDLIALINEILGTEMRVAER